jgi:glycosyltransferase involved in cell wall biosynthesis
MKIFIAIPSLNELEILPLLLDDLKAQTYGEFEVFVCVNNPDEWWGDPSKAMVCENNLRTMELLKTFTGIKISAIDRTSKGNGWKGKKKGVGYARKELFEAIDKVAEDDDVVISLDADTRINPAFVDSVRKRFLKHKKALLLTNPYYHELTGSEGNDRAILRYELYMRYYLISLLKINSPYAFTALGSAISFKVAGYRKISGITPKEAGEDFYFVNRMRKAGDILIWNDECVYPSSRESDRVPFGTGPAVSKGLAGDWESYPFYDTVAFSRIGETYRLLPELFRSDLPTPIDEFISECFGENIWAPLRKNFKTEKLFVRACHEKLDGLRILQILKYYHKGNSLKNFIDYSNSELDLGLRSEFNFENAGIGELGKIRDAYFEFEIGKRKILQVL